MKKNIYFMPLVLLLLLATGCASTKQFVPFPNQMVRIEDPNKARIYVLRPSIVGGAISMEIRDGVMIIGKTGPKGYLCWERDPGDTVITGVSENKSTLPVSIAKGVVYYIKQEMRMGFIKARNKISFIDEIEWRKLMIKRKPPVLK